MTNRYVGALGRCDHCYRPAVAVVHRRGFWRTLFFQPTVTRYVCIRHLDRYRRR